MTRTFQSDLSLSIRVVAVIAAVVFGVLSAASSEAEVVLTIERLSDTQIRVVGSGISDFRPAQRGPRLRIGQLFATPPTGVGTTSDNTLTFSLTGLVGTGLNIR